MRDCRKPGDDTRWRTRDGLPAPLGKLHEKPKQKSMTGQKPESPVISMPLSYWQQTMGYWKITPELLKEAQKHPDGLIGRIKDGTLLKIGNESNKK